MSHHDKEYYPNHNTDRIRAELALHGLPIDKPSQAADCFRFGWVAAGNNKTIDETVLDLEDLVGLGTSGKSDAARMIQVLKVFRRKPPEDDVIGGLQFMIDQGAGANEPLLQQAIDELKSRAAGD